MALKNGKGTVNGYKIGPKAFLTGAHLYATDLSGAKLQRADLACADLQGADLSGADLSGANLSCANLLQADLTGADLTDADLLGAHFSSATVDPDHVPLIEAAKRKEIGLLLVNGRRTPNPRHYGPRGRYGR